MLKRATLVLVIVCSRWLATESALKALKAKENAMTGMANVHVLPKGPTWPHKTVPYVMDKGFSSKEKGRIVKAMKHFEDATCIKFKPRKKEHGHVRIYKRLPDDPSGEESAICGSELGYAGPKPHILVLGNSDCFLHGRLLHEMMHIIGFPHEHSRTDRDQYIKIKWENMPNRGSSLFLNFRKLPGRYVKSGPYDYYSIMHYSLYSNSANGVDKTLVPTKSVDEFRIGQRFNFTHADIKKINKFYHCNKRSSSSASDSPANDPIHRRDTDVQNKVDKNLTEKLEAAEMKDRLDGPEFWKNFDVKSLW